MLFVCVFVWLCVCLCCVVHSFAWLRDLFVLFVRVCARVCLFCLFVLLVSCACLFGRVVCLLACFFFFLICGCFGCVLFVSSYVACDCLFACFVCLFSFITCLVD